MASPSPHVGKKGSSGFAEYNNRPGTVGSPGAIVVLSLGSEADALAHLRECQPLDLADTLSRDAPMGTDIGELCLTAVEETVATTNDVLRTLVEAVEHLLNTGAVFHVEYHFVGAGSDVAGD